MVAEMEIILILGFAMQIFFTYLIIKHYAKAIKIHKQAIEMNNKMNDLHNVAMDFMHKIKKDYDEMIALLIANSIINKMNNTPGRN